MMTRSFKSTFLFLSVTACGCTVLFVGCGSSKTSDRDVGTSSAVGQNHDELPNDFPIEVTDALNRRVTIRKRPQRIVSLAPKDTEILFAIGAGDQVIGVTTYCNFPVEALQRVKVGGFTAESISLEKIVSLRPDLVISVGSMHAALHDELGRLKVPTLAVTAESFSALYDELELLGRITEHTQDANRLTRSLQSRVAQIRDVAKSVPADERVSVFYQVWEDPLTAAGPTSYIGEMIEFCGGVNIVRDSSNRFPRVTAESLLLADPDVVLSTANHLGSGPEKFRRRPGWESLKAVRNNRIEFLTDDPISRCGPRLVDALDEMACALYPKYFASPERRNSQSTSSELAP